MRTKSIAKYSPIEAGLADLQRRHKDVVINVTTKEGMAAAKEGRTELKEVRLNLERARVEEKAESLAYGRFVDSEAARIKSIIEPMEDAYDFEIKKEEKRITDEKNAKLKAEQEAHAEKIRLQLVAENKLKAEAEAKVQAERDAQAVLDRIAKEEAEAKLKLAEEKIKIEREELAKAQKEVAEAKAKIEAEKKAIQEKADFEEKEKQEKILVEENKKKEEEEIKQREVELKRREEAAVAKAILEKEENILKEKQAIIDEEKRQLQLKKQLRLDARSMLQVFSDNYGNDPEFQAINNEIMNYFTNSRMEEAAI